MAAKKKEMAAAVVAEGAEHGAVIWPAPVPKTDNVSDLTVVAEGENAVDSKTAHVSRFAIADLAEFAVRLGVELSGTLEERADSAALHMSSSQRHMLASGVLLMSIKSECQHGEFIALLTARGFEERAARRAMQYAEFLLGRPADERDALLGVSKYKVLALAGADPEVVEAFLEDGTERISALNVRELQRELADAKAALTDVTVQRDTAEANLAAAQKALAAPDRADGVPPAIAALRNEFMTLYKKAELSLLSMPQVVKDLQGIVGEADAGGWGDGTMRLHLSSLAALRVQLDGQIKEVLRALPGEALGDGSLQNYLTNQEKHELADQFFMLADVHGYEKAMRKHEHEAAHKTGPGRPKKEPKAPKAAGAGK